MRKLICLIIVMLFILTACFRGAAEGEIVVLTEDYTVGHSIPIVLLVPEEYDLLHKEMWSCELKEGDEYHYRNDYIIEEASLETFYSQEEVEALFSQSPVDIYRDDYEMDTLYSPRIVLFTPEESGTYRISVDGYYKTTSPSIITSLELNVK